MHLCVCAHVHMCMLQGKETFQETNQKQIRCKDPEAEQTLILFKELGKRPGPMLTEQNIHLARSYN